MAISDRVAVMDRGRLLQVGTPHELYYAPRTLFVAQFIGRANLLPATVAGPAADGLGLVLLGQPCRVPAPDRPLAPGSAVRALVRPEAVGLELGEGPGIPGKVAETLFLGEKSEYAVDVPTGERLTVTTSDPGLAALRPGDAVRLRLRGELVRLFGPEAQ